MSSTFMPDLRLDGIGNNTSFPAIGPYRINQNKNYTAGSTATAYQDLLKDEDREVRRRYGNIVGDFNASIENQNEQLSSFLNSIDDSSTNIGNYSITELGTGPFANDGRFNRSLLSNNRENPLASIENQLSGIRDSASSFLSSYGERRNQVIDSTPNIVNFAAGTWDQNNEAGAYSNRRASIMVDRPELAALNTQMGQQVLSRADSVQGQIPNLYRQRIREEDRIDSFGNQLLTQVNQLGSDLDGIGIANVPQMQGIETSLSNINNQMSGFSSPILQQLYPEGFTNVEQAISSVQSGLEGLRNQRAAEQQRIQSFQDSLRGEAESLLGQAGNLTIADADQFGGVEQALREQQARAEGFSSPLDFDFSGVQSSFDPIVDRINQLRENRAAEQQRIAQAQERFADTSNQALSQVAGLNPYSLSNIQSVQEQVEGLSSDVGGFSSLLPFDFGTAQSNISQAQSELADVLGMRESQLDSISDSISAPLSGLEDVPLYDESAFAERDAALDGISSELSQYSGGRVDEIAQQIDTARQQIDARLQMLADRRNQIEQQAQALLQEMQGQNFYGMSDVDASQSQVADIEAEADLYRAQQAMDDIDALMSEINSERQRLEADAQAVEARRRERQQQVATQVGFSGVPQIRNNRQVVPMNIESFVERYINANDEEENLPVSFTGSNPFSRSLGVIRVG